MRASELTEKRDPAVVAKIKQLKDSGMSVDDIAAQMSLSYNLVYKLLRDIGGIAPVPQKAKALTDEDKRSIIDAVVNQNHSLDSQVKKWKVHASVIDKLIKDEIGEEGLAKLRQDRGIKSNRPHNLPQSSLDRAATEFANNTRLIDIGNEFGLGVTAIRDIIMRLPNYEDILSARNKLKLDKQQTTAQPAKPDKLYKTYPQEIIARMAAAFAKGYSYNDIANLANVTDEIAKSIIIELPMYSKLLAARNSVRSKKHA